MHYNTRWHQEVKRDGCFAVVSFRFDFIIKTGVDINCSFTASCDCQSGSTHG